MAKPMAKKQTKNKGKKKDKKSVDKSFKDEIERFIAQTESLHKAHKMTMSTLAEAYKKDEEKFDNFIVTKGIKKVEDDGSESYAIKYEDYTEFKRIQKNFYTASLTIRNTPRSFLCSLINQYDASYCQ